MSEPRWVNLWQYRDGTIMTPGNSYRYRNQAICGIDYEMDADPDLGIGGGWKPLGPVMVPDTDDDSRFGLDLLATDSDKRIG